MNSLKEALVALWKEDDGLTMVEYAIAGGLVAAGCVMAFSTLGTDVATAIDDLANDVSSAY